MKIAVVGSMNMDIVNRVARHPRPGETVQGQGPVYSPGGKGMNQAVATALAGGDVRFVGAVGEDGFGETLCGELARRGIGTEHLIRKAGSTGLAFITVDAQGENTILLSAGANGAFAPEDLRQVFAGAGESAFDLLLVQNEIPPETTLLAMQIAKQRGARVIFNPAPVEVLADEVYQLVDVLVLNETEAEVLTRESAPDQRGAEELLRKGVGSVILTLGEKGSHYFAPGQAPLHTPAFQVQAKDTTAAGDTFIGAFAAAIAEGMALEAALSFASAAAAITVTRHGAQEAIPSREEIEEFLHLRTDSE